MLPASVFPIWVRIILGLLGLAVLAFTLPAYSDATANPLLSNLTPDLAALNSVGGGFLVRQLALALLALYGAWKGTGVSLGMGAFGIFLFNLQEGLMLTLTGVPGPGGIAGLVFAALAGIVLFMAITKKS